MRKKKIFVLIVIVALLCIPLIFLFDSKETVIMPKAIISKNEWQALAQADKVEFTQKFFNSLHGGSMDLVEIFYHPQAHFRDPIGEHSGVSDIKKYYAGIYAPVTAIRFEFKKTLISGNDLALEWTMYFKSTKLNGGQEIVVDGLSKIKFDPITNQAIEHRDYFDMGSMVYEHVPIIGRIVRYIKNMLITK